MSPFQDNQQHIILAETLVISFLVLALIVIVGAFAIHKFRLVPRLRAWMQNEPYVDIVMAESNVREMSDIDNNAAEARAAAEEQLPSVRILAKGGRSTSSAASMANLRHEDTVQST